MYRFCYENMCVSPDVSFYFDSQRIKVRSDGTATLSGVFSITGHLVISSPYEEKLVQEDYLMTPSFRLDHHQKRIVSLLPASTTTLTAASPLSSSDNNKLEQNVSDDTKLQRELEDTSIPNTNHRFPRQRDFRTMQRLRRMKYMYLRTFLDEAHHTGTESDMVIAIDEGNQCVFRLYEVPKVMQYCIRGDFTMNIDANYCVEEMNMSMLEYQVQPK